MSLSSPVAAPVEADPRTPQRVRHQPRRRELNVLRVEKIAAHMIRVTLGGDLEGFTSLGFDDHVKLFFPTGTTGADGEPELDSRDYTPRRYDPAGQDARRRIRHPRRRTGDALGGAGEGRDRRCASAARAARSSSRPRSTGIC